MTLFNVYAPPGSDKSFFGKVFDLIASETYGTLIFARGFNMLIKPLLDTTNRKMKNNATEKYINKVLKDLGLNDVWRSGMDQSQATLFILRDTQFTLESTIALCMVGIYIE